MEENSEEGNIGASSVDKEEIGGSSSGNETGIPENKRLKLENDVDRISDLPVPLIQHILSFLPSTKKAIQTGVLSKRWKNQWTHVPVLIFYSSGNENFCQFIERTLALHDCLKIKKFHIQSGEIDRDPEIPPEIYFATTKYVEEFKLPKFLFNNAFLVKLELTNCYLSRKWKPNWPCLNELKLNSSKSRFAAIQNAISGSPLLESLELTNCSAVYGHEIVSKSLKRLSFVAVNCHDDTSHLGISCPNLEELSIRSLAFSFTNIIRRMIESALSGCPLLGLLEVRNFSCDVLVIASHSLKKLVLEGNPTGCAIEIVCPILEELNLYDLEIGSLKVVILPSSIGVDKDVIVSKSSKQLNFIDVTFDAVDDHVEILWPNLEELSAKASTLCSTTLACRTIEQVLAGCPLLQSLELKNFLNDQLVIASNSLKKLVLEENTGGCEIEISCPNLEELKLDDLVIKSLIVMELPSSVCATVNLDSYIGGRNAAKQVVEQFEHVKKLSFARRF